MYFHVYLIYRFTRTFTDHSSVITKCWGFELQKRKIEPQKPANPCDTRLCSCIFSVNTRQKVPKPFWLRNFFLLLDKAGAGCYPKNRKSVAASGWPFRSITKLVHADRLGGYQAVSKLLWTVPEPKWPRTLKISKEIYPLRLHPPSRRVANHFFRNNASFRPF